MKTYKIYVDGMYVGTEDFTRSEVTAIESDQDIKLIEKQKAEETNMIQPKRSDLGASAVGWSPGSDDGRPQSQILANQARSAFPGFDSTACFT